MNADEIRDYVARRTRRFNHSIEFYRHRDGCLEINEFYPAIDMRPPGSWDSQDNIHVHKDEIPAFVTALQRFLDEVPP